jgi:hypothetical protein
MDLTLAIILIVVAFCGGVFAGITLNVQTPVLRSLMRRVEAAEARIEELRSRGHASR